MTDINSGRVPKLIHDYARAFYEMHLRDNSFRVYSHRLKFNSMTDEEVRKEVYRLMHQIVDTYGEYEHGVD